jgi:hypothetical protein
MEEITIKAYKASELPADVQEKVCEHYHDIVLELDQDWDQPIIEGIHEELSLYGIEETDIKYSGFFSQGDGLSFTSDIIDTDILIRKLYETGHDIDENTVLESKNMHVFVGRNYSRYVHEKSVIFGVNYEGEDNIDIVHLTNVINSWKDLMCQMFHSRLENYYLQLTTMESVLEALDENGFIFTESGKRIFTQ